MHGLRVRPEAAAASLLEEGSGFAIDALLLAAGYERQ
jgi:hypothetical protein